MVTAGYRNVATAWDLDVAKRIGARCVEILPNWRECPEAGLVGREVAESGLRVHSVHGGWGGMSIACDRIDLGSPNEKVRRESVDDLKRCGEWAAGVGAAHLVVHPGGLSQSEERERRTEALGRSLGELAEAGFGERFVCVENMPKGVWPGSDMGDLADLVGRLGREEIALIVDTGHGAITEDAASQTRKAGCLLASTHVHDNDGRQDVHGVPGTGVIDWGAWLGALDDIGYEGPVILECIRELRHWKRAELERFYEEIRPLLGVG